MQDTSNTSTTQTTRGSNEQHEGNISATRTTRVKNFDSDNDTSENMFSHTYISYIANERLQGEEQFPSKNYLSEMLRFYAKMSNAKAI